ncbi:MAG: hypothetical protein ACRYFU_05325 [Janthinobacterium lividum]
MPEPITILHVEHLNRREVVINFSDGTMAVLTVEDLLDCAPNRIDTMEPESDE